jgi:hypothetical protein
MPRTLIPRLRRVINSATAVRDQIRHPQRRHFPHPQTDPAHQPKHQPVAGTVDTSEESLYVRIADIARQGLPLLHPLPSPHHRVRPRVIIRLVCQELEEVMQTRQAAVHCGGRAALGQLILHKTINVPPRHFLGWLAYETSEDLQVTYVVLGRATSGIPSVHVSLELANRFVHWLPPGVLRIIHQFSLLRVTSRGRPMQRQRLLT